MRKRRKQKSRKKKLPQPDPGPGPSSEDYVFKQMLTKWHKGKIVERHEHSDLDYDSPSIVVEVTFPNERDPHVKEKWRMEVDLAHGPHQMWYASPFSEKQIEDYFYRSDYPWEECANIPGSLEKDIQFYYQGEPADKGDRMTKVFYIVNGSGVREAWAFDYSTVNGPESQPGKLSEWYRHKEKNSRDKNEVSQIDDYAYYRLQ